MRYGNILAIKWTENYLNTVAMLCKHCFRVCFLKEGNTSNLAGYLFDKHPDFFKDQEVIVD